MAGVGNSRYPVDSDVDLSSGALLGRKAGWGRRLTPRPELHKAAASGQPPCRHARSGSRDPDSQPRPFCGGDPPPRQPPHHRAPEEQPAPRPKPLDFSSEFEVDDDAPRADAPAKEVDPHRIAQRQRQIDLGKNTRGYARYRDLVPKASRRMAGRRPIDPVTPDVAQVCSKRAFDGQVKQWRRMLHQFDPPVEEDEEEIDLASIMNAPAAALQELEPAPPAEVAPMVGEKRVADPAEAEEAVEHGSRKAARVEDPEEFIYGNGGSEDACWAVQSDEDEWDLDEIAI